MKLSGSALASDSLQWFGNAVEAAIERDDAGRDVRRMYLSEYIDPQNRRHLLKNSGPGTLPKYLEDPPVDPKNPDARQFFTGFHLGHFFKLLDQALRDQLASDDTVSNVPGMASAPSSYGETAVVEPGAAVSVAQVTSSPLAAAPGMGLPLPAMGGPSLPARPSPSSAGVVTGPPTAAPRARPRKPTLVVAAGANGSAMGSQPAGAPVLPPVVESPVVEPIVESPAPVSEGVAPPVVVAASLVPTAPGPAGTTPPPPPGMRPPQRAPGL